MKPGLLPRLPPYKLLTGNQYAVLATQFFQGSSDPFYTYPVVGANAPAATNRLFGQEGKKEFPLVYTEAMHRAVWGIEANDSPSSPTNVTELNPFGTSGAFSQRRAIQLPLKVRYRAPAKAWGAPATLVRPPRTVLVDDQLWFDVLVADAALTQFLDDHRITIATPNLIGVHTGGFRNQFLKCFIPMGLPISQLSSMVLNGKPSALSSNSEIIYHKDDTTVTKFVGSNGFVDFANHVLIGDVDEKTFRGGEVLLYSFDSVFENGSTNAPILSYWLATLTTDTAFLSFSGPFPPVPDIIGHGPYYKRYRDSNMRFNDDLYAHDLDIIGRVYPRFAAYRHVHYEHALLPAVFTDGFEQDDVGSPIIPVPYTFDHESLRQIVAQRFEADLKPFGFQFRTLGAPAASGLPMPSAQDVLQDMQDFFLSTN